MGVCVGSLEIEPGRQAIDVSSLERIERGIGASAVQGSIRKVRIRPAARNRTRAGSRLVYVGIDENVDAILADIGHRKGLLTRKLSLNVEVPLVGGWVRIASLIHLEGGAGCGEQTWASCGETRGNGQSGGKAIRACAIGSDNGSVEGRVLSLWIGIVSLIRVEDTEATADDCLRIEAIGETGARREVGISPVCPRSRSGARRYRPAQGSRH